MRNDKLIEPRQHAEGEGEGEGRQRHVPVTGKLLETLVIQLLDRGRGRRRERERVGQQLEGSIN